MSQATTAIADGTGAQVLAELTSAFSAAQSWQFGSTDPYTAGYNVNAGTWWMDQGNMLVKQRNITNDAWITKGKINADGTISLYDDLGRIISQTYLEKSGGTINGDISSTGSITLKNATNNSGLYLSDSYVAFRNFSSASNPVVYDPSVNSVSLNGTKIALNGTSVELNGTTITLKN